MTRVAGRGVELWYEDGGAGPAVLWHTGGCGDLRMWVRAGYLDALPGYRHLLLDHRGHGRSEAPADGDYSMAAHVVDIVAVLDDAGVERATVVGYSLGARVGLALAMAHPSRMDGLVAIDAVPARESQAEALAAGAARVRAEGTRAILEAMGAGEGEPPPTWLLDHLAETDAAAFAGAYEAEASEDDFWTAAPGLAVPTLFLVGVAEGEDDWEALARSAADTVPEGEVVVLAGFGHLQAFWRVDATLPAITDFLARWAVT